MTRDSWSDPTSNPLQDVLDYVKALKTNNYREPTYEERKLVVPTALVKGFIRLDSIQYLWEYSATIIVNKEAHEMLQKYCSKNNIEMPGKCEVFNNPSRIKGETNG